MTSKEIRRMVKEEDIRLLPPVYTRLRSYDNPLSNEEWRSLVKAHACSLNPKDDSYFPIQSFPYGICDGSKVDCSIPAKEYEMLILRRISFRGKRISDGKWVYGQYLPVSKNGNTIHLILTDAEIDGSGHLSTVSHEVDPFTVGQCMDSIDNYLNNIYEGDIVDLYLGEKNDPCYRTADERECEQYVFRAIVLHEQGIFMFRLIEEAQACEYDIPLYCLYEESDCEVIGNVFDNPELIPENIL